MDKLQLITPWCAPDPEGEHVKNNGMKVSKALDDNDTVIPHDATR